MGERYVVPLDLGDTEADRGLYYLRRGGEKEVGKRIAVYIGGCQRKIIVDTGAPDPERAFRNHPYSKPHPLKPNQGILAQLAQVGITPAEIEIVVLTHLHWDHVGGVSLFPNAEFIVSGEELKFALDPVPCLYLAYEARQLGMQPEFSKVIDRIKTIDLKEEDIVEGVRVIPLTGHTPGNIGVVVDTPDGPHVIAGDAAPKYANLNGSPEQGQRFIMSGIYTDMIAMWKSLERIDEIVDHDYSRVIPGHDPLVFK